MTSKDSFKAHLHNLDTPTTSINLVVISAPSIYHTFKSIKNPSRSVKDWARDFASAPLQDPSCEDEVSYWNLGCQLRVKGLVGVGLRRIGVYYTSFARSNSRLIRWLRMSLQRVLDQYELSGWIVAPHEALGVHMKCDPSNLLNCCIRIHLQFPCFGLVTNLLEFEGLRLNLRRWVGFKEVFSQRVAWPRIVLFLPGLGSKWEIHRWCFGALMNGDGELRLWQLRLLPRWKKS